MAKKRIVKKYRRKGRWSANIRQLTNDAITTVANGTFVATTILCQNPAQNSSTVSQQYTVKNVEVSFQIETSNTGESYQCEGLTVFIMYVPQGMTVDNNYPSYHPEYIMAMRYLGSPDLENTGSSTSLTTPGRNPLRVKTRLARRLQTGDSVILLIRGTTQNESTTTLRFQGILRWWTKAN